MCETFESGDQYGVKWIHGKHKMTDALTKPSEILSIPLSIMLAGIIWDDTIEIV